MWYSNTCRQVMPHEHKSCSRSPLLAGTVAWRCWRWRTFCSLDASEHYFQHEQTTKLRLGPNACNTPLLWPASTNTPHMTASAGAFKDSPYQTWPWIKVLSCTWSPLKKSQLQPKSFFSCFSLLQHSLSWRRSIVKWCALPMKHLLELSWNKTRLKCTFLLVKVTLQMTIKHSWSLTCIISTEIRLQNLIQCTFHLLGQTMGVSHWATQSWNRWQSQVVGHGWLWLPAAAAGNQKHQIKGQHGIATNMVMIMWS